MNRRSWTLRHSSGRELTTPAPLDENGIKRGPGGISLAMNDGGDTAYFMIRNPRGPVDGGPARQLERRRADRGRQATAGARGRCLDHRQGREADPELGRAQDPRPEVRLRRGPAQRQGDPDHADPSPHRQRAGPARLGPWHYGKRKLRVHVLQRYETPRDVLLADVYRVRPPRKPERPRHVRAVRRMRDLVVRWQPGARFASQQVVVRTADGTRYEVQVGRPQAGIASGTSAPASGFASASAASIATASRARAR